MILKILIYFSSINEKHIEIKYASVKTKLCTNKSDIIGKKCVKLLNITVMSWILWNVSLY